MTQGPYYIRGKRLKKVQKTVGSLLMAPFRAMRALFGAKPKVEEAVVVDPPEKTQV